MQPVSCQAARILPEGNLESGRDCGSIRTRGIDIEGNPVGRLHVIAFQASLGFHFVLGRVFRKRFGIGKNDGDQGKLRLVNSKATHREIIEHRTVLIIEQLSVLTGER